MENKIKKFWNTSKSISHMMRTSKLLIDESLSWKKKSVPCFPEIVFLETQNVCGLHYCLTYLSHHPIKMVFSLLDNAPIYPTRYIVGCVVQKNLFQYFEALCSKSTVLWTVKRKCWPSEPVRLHNLRTERDAHATYFIPYTLH